MTKRNVDWILIEALARGDTKRAAAKEAGVSERTVRRRCEDPEFMFCVGQRRVELIREFAERTGNHLAAAANVAVDSLADVAANSSSDAARVHAAIGILNHTPRPADVARHLVPTQPDESQGANAVTRKLEEMSRNIENAALFESGPKAAKSGQNWQPSAGGRVPESDESVPDGSRTG